MYDFFFFLVENLGPFEKLTRQTYHYNEKKMNHKNYCNNSIATDVKDLLLSYARFWQIHPIILIFNLNRLFNLIPRLTLKDYWIEINQLGNSYELSIEEWFIALEFYLQMDGKRLLFKSIFLFNIYFFILVSCFYMKTCTFRKAKPRLQYEGIFGSRQPEARYGMKQCQDKSCRFCYERIDLTNRWQPAIHFTDNQVHRFVNNYQVYLNCDVVSIKLNQ